MNYTSLFAVFTSFTEMYKKNKTAFYFSLLFTIPLLFLDQNLYKNPFKNEDITKEYIEKTTIIEKHLYKIRQATKSDNISVFLLNNGSVTFTRLHLLKFTLLFESSEQFSNNKFILQRQPLSPYLKYVSKMLNNGYFLIEDTEVSSDPLLKMLYSNFNKKTVLYLPVYQANKLVGFVTISYTKKTKLTPEKIQKMYRYIDLIESEL